MSSTASAACIGSPPGCTPTWRADLFLTCLPQVDVNDKCRKQLTAAASGAKSPGGSNKRPRLSPGAAASDPLVAEITQGQAQLLSWAEEKVRGAYALVFTGFVINSWHHSTPAAPFTHLCLPWWMFHTLVAVLVIVLGECPHGSSC